MQEKRKSRLTAANVKSIQKIALWGRKHPRYRKQIIAVLVICILWFYLLSTLCGFWNKYGSFFAGVATGCVLMILFFTFFIRSGSLGATKQYDDQEPSVTAWPFMDAESQSEVVDGLTQTPDLALLQQQNQDCVGWLFIEDTEVNYPLMQHIEDENYYLDKDFNRNPDSEGCLILDNDSDLSESGGNLIIHGHNNSSGSMFGNLDLYQIEDYGREHNLIQLKTIDEVRTYLVMSVFYSQVYYEDQEVFKYYQYFGGSREEFNDFVKNIKEMSIYDTGVNAVYGDEFITLSTCTYHVDNGRFVVVGKRIY